MPVEKPGKTLFGFDILPRSDANQDVRTMALRAFDLFCGAGGSSCGAQMAGASPVGGIDRWSAAIRTFDLNFPRTKTYCRTIRRLGAIEVAQAVGRIELLLASPECTNHSVAKGGAERNEDSRRTAYEVIRFAKVWRPRWLVVENVVSMQQWHAYADWQRKLLAIGYHLKELKLNAEDFGVPQSRRRLFIVGDLKRDPRVPRRPERKRVPLRSILNRCATNGYNYKLRPLYGAGRARPTLARARRAIESLGATKPFLLVYYGSDAAGGWQALNRPLRTITTLDRFALVRPSAEGHLMRMLQPPELAAAMGFPADYIWPDMSRRDHIKLIGNAVSPPVMKEIVASLCF